MAFWKKLRPSRETLPFCSAVVVAAGHSTRMGQDKIFAPLNGMPVLAHTLLALEHCASIGEIILVTRSAALPDAGQLCRTFGIRKASQIIAGGDTRAKSVLAGLRAVSPSAELIAIQDGARPFLTPALADAVIRKASISGAAAPAVPVRDTIKTAVGGVVTDTPERSTLFAVQTPQVFEASLIKGAIQKAVEENWPITDDCSAVEKLGMSVLLVPGSPENVKLTTPADFAMAEGICRWRQEGDGDA